MKDTPLPRSLKERRVLSLEEVDARKDAELELIKARIAEKERYNKDRARQKEVSIIEKAKLKRLNPTAFSSENAPAFDATGQVARDTPEVLDAKQRKESIRALGRLSYSSEPRNFVVEKPLKPNAMDVYQAQKMQKRALIRNEKRFAPVQKL